MAKVNVVIDRMGNTLTVWFENPKREHVCEEIDDDIILMKDRRRRVIGFEMINYQSKKRRNQGRSVPVEIDVL